ncbi:MAG: sugar phosphate isomerase/epimerase [Chloroflexi bacterium]|nr:MAG: sugar phosphate isomerase/epimerase [Chloroflexota bacterium]
MEIGIFATTFLNVNDTAPDLDAILERVVVLGLRATSFDTLCLGLPSMPDTIDPAQVAGVRDALAARGLWMASLSATFNMAHPDVAERETGLRRLEVLAASAHAFGTDLLTLCTGTRSRESMWRFHPENATEEAWADMRATMEQAIAIAEKYDLRLGIEPEVANVVSSPRAARRLLDEMRSPRLTIVMDGANIFPAGTLPRQREILDEAFALLGNDIGMAHAKDLTRDGAAGNAAAGTGLLDYGHYIHLLRQSGFDGALVLHGLSSAQAAGCVAFLKSFDIP